MSLWAIHETVWCECGKAKIQTVNFGWLCLDCDSKIFDENKVYTKG